MRADRAGAVPQAYRRGRNRTHPEGEHPREHGARGPQEGKRARKQRQGQQGQKARRRTDGLHRHHGAGEERDFSDGLQASQQDYQVLP